MKYARNAQLKGRNDKLTLSDGKEQRPLHVLELFKIASARGPENPTMESYRRCGKILDGLEKQEGKLKDKGTNGHLEIGDDDWEFLKPVCESVLVQAWGINAPYAFDHLTDLINKGKVGAGVPAIHEVKADVPS